VHFIIAYAADTLKQKNYETTNQIQSFALSNSGVIKIEVGGGKQNEKGNPYYAVSSNDIERYILCQSGIR